MELTGMGTGYFRTWSQERAGFRAWAAGGKGFRLSDISLQKYQPPGPVGTKFIKSRGPIDLIMGPAGSGKTVASCFKGPHMLADWYPVCRDGVIRARIAVIRDTYRDLARTCLASWHEMFPEKHPFTTSYTGGIDRPVKHTLEYAILRDNRQVKVELEMQFGAIGDNNAEQFIKGYEITAGWMNECDLLDGRVPGLFWQRTGRYPPASSFDGVELEKVVGPYRKRLQGLGVKIDDTETLLPRVVWGDMNPPDIDNWSYETCVEKPNPMFNLFKQPSGLSDRAENRIGKPRSSYEIEALTMQKHDVRRYVLGEFGYARDGEPIFPEFNLELHRADDWLKPIEGIPLLLGFDLGGSPACVVAQSTPEGQLRLLREICCTPGSGPMTIARLVQALLLDEYQGFAIGGAWIDPSGFYGADRQSGQLAGAEVVAQALGFNIAPGPSQEPGFRTDSVRWYLNGLIDGHMPRMIIDPRCKMLIGGFVAHYKLTKQASAGATNLMVADKNPYSHIHDALQYLVTGFKGRAGAIGDLSKTLGGKNVVQIGSRRAKSDFNVWDI
jgi:hypothetical protein